MKMQTDPARGRQQAQAEQNEVRFTDIEFRQILGQYPTGVVVVAATTEDGPPLALTVGSFTSLSLDPPLVAFCVATTSSSWPGIQARGAFCVNVLGADQEQLCRTFAMKSADKFSGVSWRPASSGSPIINGSVAWIDCTLESVQVAGDHFLVIARVAHLGMESGRLPLLFFRGGYGRFAPLSLATGDLTMMSHLRGVDVIRTEMESLAEELRLEVLVGARVSDEFVLLAGAAPQLRDYELSRVGRRMPFVAPLGAPIAAWSDDLAQCGWYGAPSAEGVTDEGPWARTLSSIRDRGYYVGLGETLYADVERVLSRVDGTLSAPDHDLQNAVARLRSERSAVDDFDPVERYEVRSMSAPIFGSSQGTVLQFSLYGFQSDSSGREIEQIGARLVEGAQRATALLGGRLRPGSERA